MAWAMMAKGERYKEPVALAAWTRSRRLEKRAAELEAEVAKWLSTAAAADAEEDKLHGRDKTGDEMPDWIADKKRRAERIRQAKAELEAEASGGSVARSSALISCCRHAHKNGC
jgi:hypothetical protein